MAIKNLISEVGFNDSQIGWVVTFGLGALAEVGGASAPISATNMTVRPFNVGLTIKPIHARRQGDAEEP